MKNTTHDVSQLKSLTRSTTSYILAFISGKMLHIHSKLIHFSDVLIDRLMQHKPNFNLIISIQKVNAILSSAWIKSFEILVFGLKTFGKYLPKKKKKCWSPQTWNCSVSVRAIKIMMDFIEFHLNQCIRLHVKHV